MEVKKGEIYLADLSSTKGTEQNGIRPVLIVQTNRANTVSPHTIIVPLTTKIRNKILPSHVFISKTIVHIVEDSVILCEQIRVIDKTRLIKKIGVLPMDLLIEVNTSLKIILDI